VLHSLDASAGMMGCTRHATSLCHGLLAGLYVRQMHLLMASPIVLARHDSHGAFAAWKSQAVEMDLLLLINKLQQRQAKANNNDKDTIHAIASMPWQRPDVKILSAHALLARILMIEHFAFLPCHLQVFICGAIAHHPSCHLVAVHCPVCGTAVPAICQAATP